MNVTCPLCHAPIPIVESDRPDSKGLSSGVDDRLMEEHIQMHRNCTCEWNFGAMDRLDIDCPVHGLPVSLIPDEPDPVFTEDELK